MVGLESGAEAMSVPPVIDAHHHFWDPERLRHPWLTDAWQPLRRPFGPADLEPELKREGMTGSVLVQTLPSDEETAALLATAREVSWRARGRGLGRSHRARRGLGHRGAAGRARR